MNLYFFSAVRLHSEGFIGKYLMFIKILGFFFLGLNLLCADAWILFLNAPLPR